MSRDILVSTPDLRASLLSIVSGLGEQQRLHSLITTLGFSETCLRRLRRIPAVGKALSNRFQKRRIPAGLEHCTRRIWSREVMRALTNRFISRNSGHRVWYWAECGFDRTVARRYAGRTEYLYGMEHSSVDTFRTQHERGGKCVLRMVNAHGEYLNRVMVEEAKKFPEYVNDYYRLLIRDAQQTLDRKRAEYAIADYTIANSEFVKQTLVEGGMQPERIFAVPTGCPEVVDMPVRQPGARVRFLFVGSLSLRKGFHYLLKAWQSLNPGLHAELVVAGQNELGLSTENWQEQGIYYRGVLNTDEIKSELMRADVFVLPTLAEGLSHAALEALSYGLPIITTEASGLGHFCEHEENGYLVQMADSEALETAVQWGIEHQDRLADMGECSRRKAGAWSVEDSNLKHLEILDHIITRAA